MFEVPCDMVIKAVGQQKLRNFFTDVASVGEVVEFREHFNSFSVSDEPARSFNVTLRAGQAVLSVRVLMGRVRKRTDRGSTKSILVHIRRS